MKYLSLSEINCVIPRKWNVNSNALELVLALAVIHRKVDVNLNNKIALALDKKQVIPRKGDVNSKLQCLFL